MKSFTAQYHCFPLFMEQSAKQTCHYQKLKIETNQPGIGIYQSEEI